MGLDFIQKDVKSILTNVGDFGTGIVLTAPTSPVTTLSFTGFLKKHHTTYDASGIKSRSKGNTMTATVDVSTLTLDDNDYPYRNDDGRADFKNHLVTVSDVSGEYTYKVEEWYPNEFTGNIVLVLGYYE